MPDTGEWTFFTSDPHETCAVCGAAIRVAQAAGYIDGKVVHARCYRAVERYQDDD